MAPILKPFDFRNANDEEYVLFNNCRNRIRAERLPDDPPIPLKETIQTFKNIPPFVHLAIWAMWDEEKSTMVGYGLAQLSLEDNLHMAQITINVTPRFRRMGLGRQLLAEIVKLARTKRRRLLITSTVDRIPAGEAFMTRIGAERGLETHTNQLVIGDLDQDLLSKWVDRAMERAAGFEVGLWEGSYPEEDMDAIVSLYGLLNQQPLGDLDVEEIKITADQLRQIEQSVFARGFERWTYYVRERATEKFAGYTETLWNPNRAEIISQEMTGVFPEYRNRGIGRWLKAVMLQKILADRSQAKYVRTQNADVNAPMLKINTELGFKPYTSECVWQVAGDQASSYLSEYDLL